MLVRIVLPLAVVFLATIFIWLGCFGFSAKPKLIEKEIPANQLAQ